MSQFIEMFDFHELNLNSPSKDFESMCLDDTSSATKIPAAEYLQEGKYAVYDQAQEKDIAGYSNTEQGLCRNYPAVLFGDHSRVVKYINEPFFIGADGVKIIRPRKDNLIPEFLYYDLKYHNIPNTGYNRHFKYIKMISLTKASLEEQSQFLSIAHQVDKSGFDGRKSQFIEMFGDGNWPQKTLGEVGSFTRGGGFLKSDFVEHGIPCIHYGQIHTKFGPFITSHITEISSDLESKTKFASKGDLVIAITSEDTEGSCKSTAWLGDYPVAVGGHAAIYKHSMNPLYMSFFFKSTLFNYAKIEYVHGTKVFEIKPDDIAKILVPCPPMSLQNQFSAIAEQSDKSGSGGRESVALMGKVKKSLINYYNI